MSERPARRYANLAIEILNTHGPGMPEASKALILASLAQAEAAIETADLLRNGIALRHAEELGRALDNLAYKLPGR